MTENTTASLKDQVAQLMKHIETETPELTGVVRSYRRLDKIAYKLGLLEKSESYVTDISWWPLIAVLGTFSSGKSTFINQLLGQQLQKTGNQAIDDKFTVICYGPEETPRVLPAMALDSDPRFPFYRISRDIEAAKAGEGQRLDAYLQLKTSNSDEIRGKIIIDSPGFDADAQRTATLRITDHIIDLSDLVLVFFDARHPEPGAMRDTLDYLVTSTLQRPDFGKFMHILNQIDNTAREDNSEEVFGAWQRALAQKGLTTGQFYRIYDPAAAAPIDNEHVRRRFEAKREEDMGAILGRIETLQVERSYRVVGRLENLAKTIRDKIVPRLVAARRAWRRRLLWLDALVFGGIIVLLLLLSSYLGYWQGLNFEAPWLDNLSGTPWLMWTTIALIALGAYTLHRVLRRFAARAVERSIRHDESLGEQRDRVAGAFAKNVRSEWPLMFSRPKGWGMLARRRLESILSDAYSEIQALNDRYADPSGKRTKITKQAENLPVPAPERPAPVKTGNGDDRAIEKADQREPRRSLGM